ncbi:two component transcriptional regulator, LuxR family [Carboxydocella sporoproducens DSM 16521]|uniref:Stage 0 sporulation protein A homolog n=2 Tax=Carboxydocella TaxID=178898 RepID=A0A1T4Q3N5_9FIRM|nr:MULTISPECIES: response regulator transcription factor [Carboxydocella]AVX21149.1 two component transcriptional regulator, LuxR family [Carboxydocella thermautotrophica]AVX31584.1 two component transcriptional regulator, LuxR family [Carboxydocella thermautotrophica]SJZ98435.1 two component transcriptional regulator, LuxR family [Carboxydocella sporoproducens DSM 16521]
MIKILLVDDHAVLRSGLKMLIGAQKDMLVVGEAATAEEALDLALTLDFDLALVDLSMPGMGGIALVEQLSKLNPACRVLVLTMHEDEGYVKRVLQAGAHGYLLKKAADIELLSAIRSVYEGKIFVDPAIAGFLLKELAGRKPEKERKDPLLTEREREVLALIARGYTNKEIADQLFISVKTVEVYKAKLKEKLRAKGRSELVRAARELGISP